MPNKETIEGLLDTADSERQKNGQSIEGMLDDADREMAQQRRNAVALMTPESFSVGGDAAVALAQHSDTLDKFGVGFKEGWGARPLGLSPETEKGLRDAGILTDYEAGRAGLVRTFNDAFLRGGAIALDFAMRLPYATARGMAETDDPALSLLGGAASAGMEAFPVGHLTGLPHNVPIPQAYARGLSTMLDEAHAKDVIGTGGEEAFQGIKEPLPEKPANVTFSDLTIGGEKVEGPIAAPQETAQPTTPDIHTLARRVAPDVFQEYDALSEQRATNKQLLDELAQQRDRGSSPEIARLDDQLDALRAERLTATGRDRTKIGNQIIKLEDQRRDLVDALPETGDTPEMARIRQDTMNADYRMRDLAPDVSAAYRRAQDLTETEGVTPNTPQAPVEAAMEPSEASAATTVAKTEQPAPAAPTVTAQSSKIADTVAKQLTDAGRPDDEANAAGAVVASYYETRAQRLGGIDPDQLYESEGAVVRGAKAGGRAGMAAGKARVMRDGRTTITLFEKADASTFVHEMGHQWLEQLIRDAGDARAIDQVRTDAQTVRDWLGSEKAEPISTRQHEKFARGFEQYMREGIAPSRALVDVFAQFKEWLLRLYGTATRLAAPITDDIRGVFDRMLSAAPERTVIAGERETAPPLGERHLAEANATPLEAAAVKADEIRAERDREAPRKLPEIENERQDSRTGTEATGNETGDRVPDRGRDAGQSDTGTAGERARLGAIGEGGGTVTPQGDQPSGTARNSEPNNDTGFRARPDVIDKAGNIRLDKINTTEAMEAALKQIAADNGDFMDARYGNRAYQQASEIRNTRTLLRLTTGEYIEAAQKATETGLPEDAAEFITKSQRAAMVFDHLSSIYSDWAHAGHALREVMPGFDQARDIASQIKEVTGRTLFQIQEQAALAAKFDDPEAAAKFASDMEKTRWQRARAGILSYFINNLISGPITHMAYSVGNTVLKIYTATLETGAQAAAGAVREMIAGEPVERVYFREVGTQLFAMFHGFREGLIPAMKALDTGVPYMRGEDLLRAMDPDSIKKSTYEQNIPGLAGRVLETPSRVVTMIHTIFYSMGFEQELARLATRDAIAKGAEGDAFNRAVAEFMQNPPKEAIEAAHSTALTQVLMKRPVYGTLQYTVQKWINDPKGLPPGFDMLPKMAMPFMQIGANILGEGLGQRTALSMLSGEARAELLGKRGGVAQDIRIGKIATGSMVSVAVLGMAMEGLITGPGPSDTNKRRVLEEGGWKPYSVKIGDLYIPYRKFLGPLGPIVGATAAAYELGHEMTELDAGKAAAAIGLAFSEVVTDETWMRGLTDLIQSVREPERYGGRWLRNLAADFVPFSVGMGQVARQIDPYMRDARTVLDTVRNRIPVLSETAPPQIGIWGTPVPSHTMLSPSTGKNDPVDNWLKQLDIGIAPPERKIRNVQLTPEQYTDFASRAGIQLRKMLEHLVQNPTIQRLPAGIQADLVKREIKMAHKIAADRVMIHSIGSDNDIIHQAIDAKRKHVTEPVKQP